MIMKKEIKAKKTKTAKATERSKVAMLMVNEEFYEILSDVTKKKGLNNVATILNINRSSLSRLLTRKIRLTQNIGQKILTKWEDLELTMSELISLYALWPQLKERTQEKIYIDCSSVLFIAYFLLAQKKGYFNEYAPSCQFLLRWCNKDGVRLAGKDIVERIAARQSQFGLAHENLLKSSYDLPKVDLLFRIGNAVESRICVPKAIYRRAKEEAKIDGKPFTFKYLFLFIVGNHGEWTIHLNRHSNSGDYLTHILEEMDLALSSEERVALSESKPNDHIKHISYEGLLIGQAEDGSSLEELPCIVVTWSPMPFFLKAGFIDCSELFYDANRDPKLAPPGEPLFERNIVRSQDIYRISNEYPLSATIFADKRLQRKRDLYAAVYAGLHRVVAFVRGKTEDMPDSIIGISEDLYEVFGLTNRSPHEKEIFRAYIEDELRRVSPHVYIEVLDPSMLVTGER